MTIYPDIWKDFQCKGGSCAHTCCQTWEIDIDDDTAAYYQSLEGPLGDDVRQAMAKGEEGYHIAFNTDGFCPLLTEDGWCRLVLAYGEDALCDICHAHPRFYTEWGDICCCGTGLCCEKTVELLASVDGPLTFSIEETETKVDFAGLLRALGIEAAVETAFVPYADEKSYSQMIAIMKATEPIDAAWSREMDWLASHVPAAMAAAEAYSASYDRHFFTHIYQYIAYRQLDVLDYGGVDEALAFARLGAGFIFLEAALHGDEKEQARRWSEQIEYDLDNVELIYEKIFPLR